jgi:hypothetical protein
MKNKLPLLIVLLIYIKTFAQVGINTTSPDPSSILDIQSTDKGILIPRVALISTIDITTVLNPITSLLVYNTNVSTGVNATTKGFYYWNGTKWSPLLDDSRLISNWLITGNDNISTDNFLGTTTNNNVSIRTNNVEKVRVTVKGQIETYNIGESVFIGRNSGASSQLNQSLASVFIGENSGFNNSIGIRNTAIGAFSLDENTSGIENVALGHNALTNNTNGNGNVGLGFNAGSITTSGTDNISIGRNSGPNANWIGNSISIGVDATATGWGQVRIGNTTVSSIGGYANWTNLSDGRFKFNVRQDVPGLNFIEKLTPVTYNVDYEKLDTFLGVTSSKNHANHINKKQTLRQTGFIAQDVERITKNLGYNFSGIEIPTNENNSHYGLRYSEFVVPLVKSVQELKKIIDLQQLEIEKLKDLIKEN